MGCLKYLPLLLMVGCADYAWELKSKPSSSYEWVVVSNKESLHQVCAIALEKAPRLAACAFQIQSTGKCWIYSIYTAEQAKLVYAGDQLDLFEHEMKHCQGWRHG